MSTLEIMVNACYGGFGLSRAAMDEYRRQCPSWSGEEEDIARHDGLMVQIVKDLGAAANAQFADVELRRIPSRYERHYSIHEYDGQEGVVVDHAAYTVDAARAILSQHTLTKADKLARLAAVLNATAEADS